MKSLEERQAFRAKQKAEEKKAREASPTIQTRQEANKNVGTEGEETFNANDWLDDTATNITENLKELSDSELNAIEASEGNGKKRASVLAAIKKEKGDRASKASQWSPNNV